MREKELYRHGWGTLYSTFGDVCWLYKANGARIDGMVELVKESDSPNSTIKPQESKLTASAAQDPAADFCWGVA